MKIILNFKDADTFKKLERQAYDGTIDISDFPPSEYKYFSELKKIYYAFKFERLSKEESYRRKQILFRKYQEDISEHENRLMAYKQYQNNIRITEMNLSKIEKSHDIAEIALLACESLGAFMGEGTFYDRQKQKIMEGK
ncbi:MAG: hypothetical protein K2G63_03680 [Oscillospiraceae bacterium]|nr:hypothetical protein [Oscillospiraceae bacterium]